MTRPEVRVGGFWVSSISPQGWGGLKHSSRPNGSWQASWTIPDTRTWRHPSLIYGAAVEIFLGPLAVWAGTLEEPDWDAGEFIALGACRDAETAVAITAAGAVSTAPNTVIDAAITRGVLPWSRVGNFGTTPVGDLDTSGGLVTIQSVLDAWAQANNSGWRVDNQRRLIVSPTSEATVDWLIAPGSGVLGSAAEERVDRIFVRYIDSTTGRRATASYPATTPAGGVEKPVDITDRGRMTAAAAASVAQGMWSDLQGRSGWTNGLALKGGQVTTRGGIVADLATVRGGQTARLLGVPDARGIARHTDIVIGDADYDWEEDEIQINPVGLAARDTESVLEQVGNLAVEATSRLSRNGGPFAEATGSVVVSVTSSTVGTATVTLPAGRFTVTPIIEAIVTGSSVWMAYLPGTASESSFSVGVRQVQGTATTASVTVLWTARQMTATSASG